MQKSKFRQIVEKILQEVMQNTSNSIPLEDTLDEDTVKQGNSWVNKGKEGVHGKFKSKKAADAQRKAMFASGYKG